MYTLDIAVYSIVRYLVVALFHKKKQTKILLKVALNTINTIHLFYKNKQVKSKSESTFENKRIYICSVTSNVVE